MASVESVVSGTGEDSWNVDAGDLDGDGRPDLVSAAIDGVRLHELAPLQASLEQAFMELTKDSVEYHATGIDGESAR